MGRKRERERERDCLEKKRGSCLDHRSDEANQEMNRANLPKDSNA